MPLADVRHRMATVAKAIGAEVAAAAAVILGWALITSAVARFAPASVVWRVSIGLFLLSCFGWRMLGVVALQGLYALSRDEKAVKRG